MDNDPLTIAYIAIGAESHLTKRKGIPPEYCGGELEFIGECIEWASAVDSHYNEETWGGCWAYEIAEEFGVAAARAIFAHTIINRAWVDKTVERLIKEASNVPIRKTP